MGAKINIGGRDSVGPLIDGLNRRIDKTEDNLKGVSAQSKVTQRDAERLWKAAMMPAEKYNDTLKRAKVLLDGTAEGQRKYARVVEHANQKMREQNKVFDVSKLTAYAGGMLSIATAIGTVTRMMSKSKQIAEEAAASVRTSAASIGMLGQLDYFGGNAQATTFVNRARRGGMAPEAANKFAFDIGSLAPSRGDADLFRRMSTSGLVKDVGRLGPGLSALNMAFGTKHGRGAEMLLTAARGQPALAEQLGGAIGQGTYPLARDLGLSVEETIAAGAVMSQLSGSPETGRTQLLGIMSTMEKSGVKGTSLHQFASEMGKLSDADILERFPERRGRAGIKGLRNPLALNKLRTLTAEVMQRGTLEAKIAETEAMPAVAAATAEEAAKQTLLLQNAGAGMAQMYGNVGIAETQGLFGDMALGRLRQSGAAIVGQGAQMFTDDPRAASSAAFLGGGMAGNPFSGIARMVEELISLNNKQGDLQHSGEN